MNIDPETGEVLPSAPSASSPSTEQLYTGVVAAQRAAKPVDKAGWNDWHKYSYAEADAIIAEGRRACNAGGLALVALGGECIPEPHGKASARLTRRIRLCHESGQWLEWMISGWVVPEKGRPEDKAEYGASTVLLSYAYRDLLGLERAGGQASAIEDSPEQRDDNAPATDDRQQAKLGDAFMKKLVELKTAGCSAENLAHLDRLKVAIGQANLPGPVLKPLAELGGALDAEWRTQLEAGGGAEPEPEASGAYDDRDAGDAYPDEDDDIPFDEGAAS